MTNRNIGIAVVAVVIVVVVILFVLCSCSLRPPGTLLSRALFRVASDGLTTHVQGRPGRWLHGQRNSYREKCALEEGVH
jgi:hypothetical protein